MSAYFTSASAASQRDFRVPKAKTKVKCKNLEKDGVSAAQEILAFHPEANIVVCTSAAQKFKMKQLADMGITNFVIKPFQPEKFLNVVTQACGLT